MIDKSKSDQKSWKVLAKEYIFGKLAYTHPATLPKYEPYNWYFSSNLYTSKKALLQSSPQMRKQRFWNWVDFMLVLKVSSTLFSAIAVFTLKWWMVNLLRNKEESLVNTVFFRVPMIKWYMKITEWKHSGKCSAWYMKVILKLQYEFADAQRSCLMG